MRAASRAVGFDRSRLDPALLELARRAGADVRLGCERRRRRPGRRPPSAFATRRDARAIRRTSSSVPMGRAPSSRRRPASPARRLAPRLGLTYHLPDPDAGDAGRDARMRIMRDGYVGIAPVAGGRVNVGIVLGALARRVAARGGRAVADAIVAAIPPTDDDPATWRAGRPPTPSSAPPPSGHGSPAEPDGVGCSWATPPGSSTPSRAKGSTGPGLDRARGRGDPRPARDIDRAFAAYDRRCNAGSWPRMPFRRSSSCSWRDPRLFEYAARRLASRPALRATMGLAMGDLIGASRILDPRYLGALLAP